MVSTVNLIHDLAKATSSSPPICGDDLICSILTGLDNGAIVQRGLLELISRLDNPAGSLVDVAFAESGKRNRSEMDTLLMLKKLEIPALISSLLQSSFVQSSFSESLIGEFLIRSLVDIAGFSSGSSSSSGYTEPSQLWAAKVILNSILTLPASTQIPNLDKVLAFTQVESSLSGTNCENQFLEEELTKVVQQSFKTGEGEMVLARKRAKGAVDDSDVFLASILEGKSMGKGESTGKEEKEVAHNRVGLSNGKAYLDIIRNFAMKDSYFC